MISWELSNKDRCPEQIRISLRLWVDYGLRPGEFLSAVLANDLVGAFQRADSDNFFLLPAIVAYCWEELPTRCWGSAEQMKVWADLKKPAREQFQDLQREEQSDHGEP